MIDCIMCIVLRIKLHKKMLQNCTNGISTDCEIQQYEAFFIKKILSIWDKIRINK